MSVAVAVVSWNTRELLRACLESLTEDAEAGLAEVWVVDNASDDGSAKMVTDDFGWASLVASEENLGFGSAVNLVAERTDTPWVAAANADLRFESGALERLVQSGAADAGIGALAPMLMTPAGVPQHSVHSFPTVSLQLVTGAGVHHFARGLADRLCVEGSWDPSRPREVDWAHGAFLLFRRQAFDDVGGFDPGQWMYAEDLDIAWRLRREGWSVRYEPRSVIHHEVSAATLHAFGDGGRRQRYMEATYAWMTRRRGLLRTRAFALVSLAAAGVRWLFFAPLAALAPARYGARRDDARAWTRLHRIGLWSREALLGVSEAARR